ncbi:MAG: UDP-glucose/GDP-mannose dehydrogenase family protein, partial [Candidatus Diapherotrites archaeon]|nr:UDP-glucose/GDP-mannose dehydrogenase family protein [Candidatus Diapherotrites archaeon]
DIDAVRIANLQKGVMPFFEAGLPELVAKGVASNHLAFTIDGPGAMKDADVVFCAVGTPTGSDGRADLSAVFAVAELFAQHAKDGAVLVNKSTVPVGTGEEVEKRVEGRGKRFAIVSNPEFLSQSTAVNDTAHPTRIVIGTDDERAREVMRELNATFIAAGVPYIETSTKSAEAVKCAANAFLATKISFMNEVANFCEVAGADVADVATVLGLDPRIGPHFLRAGLGYGGGCLSKDVRALVASGSENGYEFRILPAVEAVNDAQKIRFYEKFTSALGGVAGKTVAVWGLSFKPGTDDMRGAPSVTIIQKLLDDGATVRAFDPAAMERSRALFPNVTYATDAFDAARG